MRFLDFSASAFAAAALLQGVLASPHEEPGSYPAEPLTTAATTYYTTLTVFRVQTTVTATRNATITLSSSTSTETASSTVATPTTLASATIPSYGNNTQVHTGATPTGIVPSTGVASGLQVCSMAVAAVAGLAGLLML